MKILSYETEHNKKDVLPAFLRSRLVMVDEAKTPEDVCDFAKLYKYDAILLCLSADRADELELIRNLHGSRISAPVIVIARSMSQSARLQVLQAGADDLIVDALSHEEIFIKIHNLIRWSRGLQSSSVSIGKVEVNMSAKKLYANGKPITLTRKEYQIAEMLALRKGMVLSKEAILDHLYSGMDEPNPKIIDVFVCKIRKKLQSVGVDDFIETNWGRGYMVADHQVSKMPSAEPHECPQIHG